MKQAAQALLQPSASLIAEQLLGYAEQFHEREKILRGLQQMFSSEEIEERPYLPELS